MFKIYSFILAAMIVMPAALSASGTASTACKTKYPIVLAHGMGASASIIGIIDYWWGIEDAIEDEGGNVYITSVNGMDSTANKAAAFKTQYLQILAATGAAKANIIGHSHGTVYTRYAITNLALSSKVASHTSISGPHRGSSVADVVFKVIPQSGWNLTGAFLDFFYVFVMGDKNPNSLQNGWEMTRNQMVNVFNPNCPNAVGVYYQSWTSRIKNWSNSIILGIPWLICKHYEGDNDGLVSVNSAKWGNFRGVINSAWWELGGVDHLNIVGQLLGITPGFSASGFFVDVAKDLKGRGY